MGKVRWTSEAERWMREIYDYIAQDNPAAALRTVQRIYEKAEILADFPESGYVYRKTDVQPIRILLHSHFRIAYVVMPGRDVDILGVFHGALDDIDQYLT
jgi:toxin ParE1/3/4